MLMADILSRDLQPNTGTTRHFNETIATADIEAIDMIDY